jgi:hypothetical protein
VTDLQPSDATREGYKAAMRSANVSTASEVVLQITAAVVHCHPVPSFQPWLGMAQL